MSDGNRGGENTGGGKRTGVRRQRAWKGGTAGGSLWVTESIKIRTSQQRHRGDVTTRWCRFRSHPRALSA